MSDNLPNLLAKRFVARRDVKAIQHRDGSWAPHTDSGRRDGNRIKWSREDLEDHLAGKQTFGHYLLNTDNHCKLFAFDIDLEKTGWLPDSAEWEHFEPCDNLREVWLDRKATISRGWMKFQFKQIAHQLMKSIYETLELQTAAVYSGGKGIHVYGFVPESEKSLEASEMREAAQIVLDDLGCFKLTRGHNFFKHENQDPQDGFPNLSIEVFPKQNSLDSKDLGNLMRLPLGRNLKSRDPTFFIDMTSPLGVMQPVDPVWALTTTNPWKRPSEQP